MTQRTAWTGGGKRIPQADARRAAMLPGRWRDVAEGRIDVKTLDDEEVFECRLRMSDGRLGERPSVVPSVVIEEQARRALQRGNDKFRMFYERCCAAIVEIASDPNQSASDRLNAAKYAIERFAGKTPDRLVLSSEDPVETLFRNILNDPDGLLEPLDVPVEPAARDL